MACFGSVTNCSKSYTVLFWTQKIVLVSKKWVFVTGPICNRIWSQKWTANVENRYGPLIHAMRQIYLDNFWRDIDSISKDSKKVIFGGATSMLEDFCAVLTSSMATPLPP